MTSDFNKVDVFPLIWKSSVSVRVQSRKEVPEISLVIQWLRLHTPNAEALGSIPGQRTKSCMLQQRTKTTKLKKKKKKTIGFILVILTDRIWDRTLIKQGLEDSKNKSRTLRSHQDIYAAPRSNSPLKRWGNGGKKLKGRPLGGEFWTSGKRWGPVAATTPTAPREGRYWAPPPRRDAVSSCAYIKRLRGGWSLDLQIKLEADGNLCSPGWCPHTAGEILSKPSKHVARLSSGRLVGPLVPPAGKRPQDAL